MKNDIIVICGFSASGKDSIARELEKNGYNFIVSTTTRPMRDYEVQNNPYKFTSNEEFLNLIQRNHLVEYRKYETTLNDVPATWYYGVEKLAVSDNNPYVVVLDTVGLREFKGMFPDRVVSFFIDCDEDVRRQRCIARGDYDKSEFERRLSDDKVRFPLDVVKAEMDYVIKSTTVEENTNEILSVMKGR